MPKGETINRLTIAKGIGRDLPSISHSEATSIVEDIVSCFAEKLVEGEEIKISGFGKFVVSEKAARKGRNPKTGEGLIIPAHRVIRFRPSPILRDNLNQVPVWVNQGDDDTQQA